jgi:hypothetical protein
MACEPGFVVYHQNAHDISGDAKSAAFSSPRILRRADQ